jgi:hypothetical protein
VLEPCTRTSTKGLSNQGPSPAWDATAIENRQVYSFGRSCALDFEFLSNSVGFDSQGYVWQSYYEIASRSTDFGSGLVKLGYKPAQSHIGMRHGAVRR